MTTNSIIQNNKVAVVLLLSIILNLIPIFIASVLLPSIRGGGIYDVLVGVAFVIQTVLIVFAINLRTIKIKNFTIIASIIFLFILSLTIFSHNIGMSGTFNKYDYINAPLRFVAFVLFFCLLSQISISKDSLIIFFKGILVLGLFASLYNIFSNFGDIFNLLSITNAYNYNFQSFYLNRNSFAQLLFFSIVANTILFKENKTKFRMLTFIILLFNLIATFSRGSLLATIIFLLVYYVIQNRKHIIKLIAVLLIALTLILTLLMTSMSIRTFMLDILIRSDVGTTKRAGIWEVAFEIISETSLIFGMGEFSAVDYLNSMGYSNSQFHSFYIEVLVSGGILLLLFFISIFFFMGRRIYILKLGDRDIGIAYISAFISMLVYGVFESISFFTMGYVGTLFTVFFISIPLMYSNNFISRNCT